MVERVIYESYEGHYRRKMIKWALPITQLFFAIILFPMLKEDKSIPVYYPYLWILISAIWLGLTIYFSFFFRKNRRR